MAIRNDWLPAGRIAIIAMCRKWIAYLTEVLRTAWGIPAEQFAALKALFETAEALLQKTMDEAER
ncbi:MAG: hypothetical protein LBK25_02485, partial [Treponema sp.]|nr:hypothetical protein [Treponema sp.]